LPSTPTRQIFFLLQPWSQLLKTKRAGFCICWFFLPIFPVTAFHRDACSGYRYFFSLKALHTPRGVVRWGEGVRGISGNVEVDSGPLLRGEFTTPPPRLVCEGVQAPGVVGRVYPPPLWGDYGIDEIYDLPPPCPWPVARGRAHPSLRFAPCRTTMGDGLFRRPPDSPTLEDRSDGFRRRILSFHLMSRSSVPPSFRCG